MWGLWTSFLSQNQPWNSPILTTCYLMETLENGKNTFWKNSSGSLLWGGKWVGRGEGQDWDIIYTLFCFGGFCTMYMDAIPIRLNLMELPTFDHFLLTISLLPCLYSAQSIIGSQKWSTWCFSHHQTVITASGLSCPFSLLLQPWPCYVIFLLISSTLKVCFWKQNRNRMQPKEAN